MILLLGNNEYVRHDIWLSIYMKKYLVTEFSFDEKDFLTKPFMTVYINPTAEQIKEIKNENTLCVVVKNRMPIKAPEWMTVIQYNKDVAKDIMKIYDEKCPYGKGREIFGIMCMEKRKLAVGGAYVHMTKKQLDAIKLLAYNYPKKFSIYHISRYFKFNADAEESFFSMVREINYKCKAAGREKLICNENEEFYMSHDIMNY